MAHIFADYASTTPCAPQVVEAMLPYFTEEFANPSSTTHGSGLRAHNAVERAREQVAKFIGAEPREILFAASSTEANNIAIQGLREVLGAERLGLAYTALEHKSVSKTVLATAEYAGTGSHRVAVLPSGLIDFRSLSRVCTDHRIGLVTLQFANNEIGTIQPLPDVAEMVHRYGAILHSDATQGLTSEQVDVREFQIDLLSFSSHKIYGPKGAAALYVRGGVRDSLLTPIIFGGEQEWGLRPGTVNVPAVVGMGAACEMVADERVRISSQLSRVRSVFEQVLLSTLPSVQVNGTGAPRVAGISSISFPGLEAEAIIARLKHMAIAFGAACDSGAISPSETLMAIGKSRTEAYRTLRVSFGKGSTEEEARALAHGIARVHAEIIRIE